MGRMRIGSGVFALVSALLLCAAESAAEWKLYVQGGIGLSGAEVQTNGILDDINPADPIRAGGRDKDTSPLLDASFGLEVPMDELVPRELLLAVRLPSWPVRFEVEAAGLREWEFSTVAGGETFFTEIKSTTVLFNQWVDIPAISIYQPFQYLFGLGRQPRVRQWLSPASFYLGAGVGVTALMDIDGTSNVVSVHDDPVDFVWNVGTGINIAVSERMTLSVGYRYVGFMEQESVFQGPAGNDPNHKVDFDLDVHELRVGLRMRVFEFASPWR